MGAKGARENVKHINPDQIKTFSAISNTLACLQSIDIKAFSFVDLLNRDLRQEIQKEKFGETEEKNVTWRASLRCVGAPNFGGWKDMAKVSSFMIWNVQEVQEEFEEVDAQKEEAILEERQNFVSFVDLFL